MSLPLPISESSNPRSYCKFKMQFVFLVCILVSFARYASAQCESYGLDFVNGGSYFIDNTLATNFTFLSEFDGKVLQLQ